MRCVIDIEANALYNPTHIWVIVCKDIDTGEKHVFRNLTTDAAERDSFKSFHGRVDYWCGHNILGYDLVVLKSLLDLDTKVPCLDTLVLSKLVDYSRPGHSIEDYGEEFGLPKIKHIDYSKYSKELEEYCVRDVDINHKVYLKYLKVINDKDWQPSIALEQDFQLLVNSLSKNGFAFNVKKAEGLLKKVEGELEVLDKEIKEAFPKRLRPVREVTPRLTKFNTISRTSVPRALWPDIHTLEAGATFTYCTWEEFNPSSHKQLIKVLSDAGWSPVDKTTTHIETERELRKRRFQRGKSDTAIAEIKALEEKLKTLQASGWKINEANLATLPENAPAPARVLAKRILLEARRRTLTEWLGLVQDDGRIHGKFYGIGAWTHRMAHQNPNTANIPTDAKLYGKEMRSLWQAPRNRLLVGVDAEGIQLRIFAHYINDKEFTEALVNGKKSDKSDPHSLNKRILGDVCKTRQEAKRFIFAYLLGAGVGKLSEILGCDEAAGQAALDRLVDRYKGLATLKSDVIPKDAQRGWFVGLDGRHVKIPGEEVGLRRHLCMSGYLQNGEAVAMKKACLLWHKELADEESIKFVNFVHDEWQTECRNNMDVALRVAKTQAESLRIVGEELKLNCPLAGSYWSEDLNDYTIGTNWSATH